MHTVALMLAVIAAAQPDPDWSRYGLYGLAAYVALGVTQIWVQRPANRAHHADCRDQLGRLVVGQTTALDALADLRDAVKRIEEGPGEADYGRYLDD
jgi:hypothetical protein